MELFFGIVIGIIFGAILFYRRPVGNLRIDRSGVTDGTYLFLELDRDFQVLYRRKKVVFRVKNQNILPHE